MKVEKPNRAFLRRLPKGRMVANINVNGEPYTIWFYPELDDDGQLSHWTGPIRQPFADEDENNA